MALRNDVARLKAIKARHSAAITPLCDAYFADKADAEHQRDAARGAVAVAAERIMTFPCINLLFLAR
jgi:hypothetical protein